MGAYCCSEEHQLHLPPINIQRSHAPSIKEAVPYQTPGINSQIQQRLKYLAPLSLPDYDSGEKLPPYKFLKNGIVYDGEWKNCQPHGYGKMYFSDGSYFEGIFIHGRSREMGRYFFPNGNYYEGQIEDGVANGKGILRQFDPNEIYKGNFCNNQLHGQGIFEGEGQRFEGTFVNGQKSKGIYIWGDCTYMGGFKDDMFEGHGVLKSPIGKYEGNFVQGKKQGKGSFLWAQGMRYQGQYKQDLKNGNGITYNNNGEIIYEGQWQNDLPNGKGKLHKYGKIIEGIWKDSALVQQL